MDTSDKETGVCVALCQEKNCLPARHGMCTFSLSKKTRVACRIV